MAEFFKKIAWNGKAAYFWATFFLVFFFTLFALFVFGLVPKDLKNLSLFSRNAGEPASAEPNIGINLSNLTSGEEVFEKPARIIIGKIDVDQPISNPESANVEILDSFLLKGVVRYPGSGSPGRKGNMLLFGHSTGFKNVKNQAFKAFNRLGELQAGDDVAIVSDKNVYIYKVVSSKIVKAEDTLVEFETDKPKLTLFTCNTFGKKEDRIVVEAVLSG